MNNILRIPIKKSFIKSLFWFFLFLPFVKPSYFGQIAILDKIFDILRIFSLCAIVWVFLLKQSISKVSVILVVFVSVNIMSTIIQEGDIYRALSYAMLGIGSFTMIELLIRKDAGLVFLVFLPIFESLIYINLFTIIKFPEGLFTLEQVSGWKSDLSWFLGLRNGMTQWILIAAYLGILNLYCGRKTKRKVVRAGLLLAACVATIFLVNLSTISYQGEKTSAGGLVAGFLLFLIYFLIPSGIKASGIISFSNAIWINIAFFFMIVIFRLQNLFSWFIEGVLEKNLTFTGRTDIWDNALNIIKGQPLLGLGFEEEITMATKLQNIAAVTTTHNSFIDILYHGGFLSMFLFLVALLTINGGIKPYNKTKISALLSYTVCVYFITAQFEGFTGVCMFILLAFATTTPHIIDKYKDAKL